jgi:hypothetical protein
MTEDWPFVSIIVPVYNGSRSIDALLTSLLALDYPADRCEILIVDNKSTDDTCERVQRYPVTLLEETEIQSSYAARNRGIRAAKGGIIAFTDADCVADPDWLRNLLADHQDHHWAGFAGGFEAYPPRTDVQRHMANTDASCFTPEFMHQPFLAPQSKGELICTLVSAKLRLDHLAKMRQSRGNIPTLPGGEPNVHRGFSNNASSLCSHTESAYRNKPCTFTFSMDAVKWCASAQSWGAFSSPTSHWFITGGSTSWLGRFSFGSLADCRAARCLGTVCPGTRAMAGPSI